MDDILIINGLLVLPEGVLPGGRLRIRDGLITGIVRGENGAPGSACCVIDAGGRLVLPGFIDLHSDAIEKEIEPRPPGHLPHSLAFRELEKKIAGQGITTMFHSISLAGRTDGVRCNKIAEDIIRGIPAWAAEKALVHHRLHLRFEVTNFEGIETAIHLMEQGYVHLLSIMDHTPGQGQYRTDEEYRDYVKKTMQLDDVEIDQIIAERREGQKRKWQVIEQLAVAASRYGVPVASHDDDHPGQVKRMAGMGFSISDFPVSHEAARFATALGHDVCVGAPNVVRGGSVSGNLNALLAFSDGSANILCSDYSPASILHAVFRLAREVFSLPGAVKTAAQNPAGAMGLGGRTGSLEPGKQADVIVVDIVNGVPAVTHTITGGRTVYSVEYQSGGD